MIRFLLFAIAFSIVPIASAHEGESDIRIYGPIHVNWSHWKKTENGYMTSITDGEKEERFLALNCEEQKINVTNSKTKWKKWWSPSPNHPFEKKLLTDFCSEKVKASQ